MAKVQTKLSRKEGEENGRNIFLLYSKNKEKNVAYGQNIVIGIVTQRTCFPYVHSGIAKRTGPIF